MYREEIWRVESMFVGEDFLGPNAQIAGKVELGAINEHLEMHIPH